MIEECRSCTDSKNYLDLRPTDFWDDQLISGWSVRIKSTILLMTQTLRQGRSSLTIYCEEISVQRRFATGTHLERIVRTLPKERRQRMKALSANDVVWERDASWQVRKRSRINISVVRRWRGLYKKKLQVVVRDQGFLSKPAMMRKMCQNSLTTLSERYEPRTLRIERCLRRQRTTSGTRKDRIMKEIGDASPEWTTVEKTNVMNQVSDFGLWCTSWTRNRSLDVGFAKAKPRNCNTTIWKCGSRTHFWTLIIGRSRLLADCGRQGATEEMEGAALCDAVTGLHGMRCRFEGLPARQLFFIILRGIAGAIGVSQFPTSILDGVFEFLVLRVNEINSS